MPVVKLEVSRKYVIGRLLVRDDCLVEFGKLASDYAATCRQEAGCELFEILPAMSSGSLFIIVEVYASEAAHLNHSMKNYFFEFERTMAKYCFDTYFEHVLAKDVVAYDSE